MQYQLHKNFIKLYRKLPKKLQKSVKDSLILFYHDSFSKKLNNHKLSGKYKNYRSINITGDYRAVYKKIEKEKVIFTLLGTHAQLYKK